MSHGVMEIWRAAYVARGAAERAGDRLGEAEAILKLGVLLRTLPHPELDSKHVMRAESIFRANGFSAKAESCLIVLAHSLFHLGRESHAIKTAKEALQGQGLPIDSRIKGFVQTALALGRLGRFDSALRLLQQDGLPLAHASELPHLIAHAKWAIGVIILQILIRRRFPALSTEPPGLIENSDEFSPGSVLSMFDQADALLTAEEQITCTALSRQFCRGLFGDTGAVSALLRLSNASAASDPLMSAWARCSAATVLMSQNRLEHASATFDDAVAMAKPLGAMALVRDATLQQSRIQEKLGDAAASLASYRRYSEMLVESLVLPIQVQPARDSGNTGITVTHEPRKERNIESLQVKRAIRFIDENIAEAFDVADVVRHCGVSRRNLETVFRRSKSATLGQYIRMRRMDRAVNLLRTTSWPIKSVALAVGYRSSTLFARAFRGQFGVNPGVWKREGLTESNAFDSWLPSHL